MHAPTFIVGLVALLAVAVLVVPLAGEARQPVSLPRIGLLLPGSLSEPRFPRFVQLFRQGLRELGYVEGQNIAIEFRWAEGQTTGYPVSPPSWSALKVNVIVANGSPAVQAAKHATETIPIVMAAVGDAVASGFVASLARPGKNITGLSLM